MSMDPIIRFPFMLRLFMSSSGLSPPPCWPGPPPVALLPASANIEYRAGQPCIVRGIVRVSAQNPQRGRSSIAALSCLCNTHHRTIGSMCPASASLAEQTAVRLAVVYAVPFPAHTPSPLVSLLGLPSATSLHDTGIHQAVTMTLLLAIITVASCKQDIGPLYTSSVRSSSNLGLHANCAYVKVCTTAAIAAVLTNSVCRTDDVVLRTVMLHTKKAAAAVLLLLRLLAVSVAQHTVLLLLQCTVSPLLQLVICCSCSRFICWLLLPGVCLMCCVPGS